MTKIKFNGLNSTQKINLTLIYKLIKQALGDITPPEPTEEYMPKFGSMLIVQEEGDDVNTTVVYSQGGFNINSSGSDFNLRLRVQNLTANRTIDFPDKTGTVAMTDDVISPTQIDVTTTNDLRIPAVSNGAWRSNGYVATTAASATTIPLRNSSGQLQASDGTSSSTSSLVNVGQFQGITNNALTTATTSANLNTSYPNAIIGTRVRSITNLVEFTRISATEWEKRSIVIA